MRHATSTTEKQTHSSADAFRNGHSRTSYAVGAPPAPPRDGPDTTSRNDRGTTRGDAPYAPLVKVARMSLPRSVGRPSTERCLTLRVVAVTPPLGAYPQPQPPQGPFLPAPPHQAAPQYGVAGGGPYSVTFGGAGAGAGGVYAPPPYDQLQHHQAIPALSQQLPMYSPAAAMYAAAAGYPGYIGYPVQYYPYYPTAMQPSIQPLRPTIMIPNGFEAGGRFEGLAQTLLPPAPPGVPPSPAHLAALQPHQVLWR